MSTWPVEKYYTLEEYFVIDEASDVRNEYFSGYIIAMAGNTPEHIDIVDNLAFAIRQEIGERPCRARTNMLRVKSSESAYVYPDITVTCGEPIYLPTSPKTLTNTIVVIEVLSETTQKLDRGEKSVNYRKLEALQQYVLVSQNEPRIELYTRMANGHWELIDLSGMDATLELTAIDVAVPFELIYQDIDFPVRLEISEG